MFSSSPVFLAGTVFFFWSVLPIKTEWVGVQMRYLHFLRSFTIHCLAIHKLPKLRMFRHSQQKVTCGFKSFAYISCILYILQIFLIGYLKPCLSLCILYVQAYRYGLFLHVFLLSQMRYICSENFKRFMYGCRETSMMLKVLWEKISLLNLPKHRAKVPKQLLVSQATES